MTSSDYNSTTFTMTAKSLDEIKEKLWEMYKNNYQIIDQQTILQGGFLGFFQKNYVKVWYIIKEKHHHESDDFAQTKEKILRETGVDYSKVAVKQYSELANMMNQMNSQINDLKLAANNNVHPSIKKVENLLAENEFSHSFISKISAKLKNEFSLEQLEDFDLVQSVVVDWIGQSIKIAPKIIYKAPHVIVLVGPTGRGKTTTISKLAAQPILEVINNNKFLAEEEKKALPVIRLITIDQIRVGAVEQLKTYGDIMGAKVDKAQTTKDLISLIQNYKDSTDYIFVDTSGCSPKDFDNIAKMRTILNVPGINFDTYLVIEASSKASDLINTIESFSIFNFNSVIITKCDETTSFGNVLSVLNEANKPISYITTGQKVPNDIQRASIKDFLYKLKGFKLNKDHIEDMFREDD